MTKNYLGKFALIALLATFIGGSASAATLNGALTAEDFGVMDQSNVSGYTAGFRLGDADFDDVESITVRLYSGNRLLQTNTATDKIEDLTGSQFSTPFDVFGTFDYEADGYWDNEREHEYGQNLVPTKVVAKVELENGKIMTATNTTLTGDPDTIFPDETTPPSSKDQCKKGGWMGLLGFKNQGQCVKASVHASASLHVDKDHDKDHDDEDDEGEDED